MTIRINVKADLGCAFADSANGGCDTDPESKWVQVSANGTQNLIEQDNTPDAPVGGFFFKEWDEDDSDIVESGMSVCIN